MTAKLMKARPKGFCVAIVATAVYSGEDLHQCFA